MPLEEIVITEAILTEYYKKFIDCLQLDVAIVGAGPSGMTAAWKLAEQGFKTAIFERKLSIGGGMWGGGMTWNFIVVQEESRHILEQAGIPVKEFKSGYYTADAVTATTTLASQATLNGTQVFNCMSVEDVVLREGLDGTKRVTGVVVNNSALDVARLHVDPLVVNCRYLVECTGHDLEVLNTLVRKNDVQLMTPSGTIEGEQSMWAEQAEAKTVDNTQEVFPGVFVAGMAANACFGSYRMGPVFGGMLLSGEKIAREIAGRLRGE